MLLETENTVKHIRRDGNKVADALAKIGAKNDEDSKILNDPILEVEELLLSDLMSAGV